MRQRRGESIDCFVCGKECGWSSPATWNENSGGSPAQDDGIGENFTDREGHWHCGKKCLRVTEEHEAEMLMQDLDLEERPQDAFDARNALIERRGVEYPKGDRDFAPRNGYCHHRNIHLPREPICGHDLVAEYGEQYPTVFISGCSHCGSSYCD